MSDGEVAHPHWTYAQLNTVQRAYFAGWPMELYCEFEGIKAIFQHHTIDELRRNYKPIPRLPTAEGLDGLFAGESELVFYGYVHRFSDFAGRRRFVNPGSLGCQREALARYTIVEFKSGSVDITHHWAAYDDCELFETFERRDVPERIFIYQTFFGGRFGATS